MRFVILGDTDLLYHLMSSYPFLSHLPRTGHRVVMKQEERVKAKTTGTCRWGDGETVLQPTCGSLMRESKS